MTREDILGQFPDDEFVFLDDLDEAIVGVVTGFNKHPVVCYDRDKVLKILQKRSDMSDEDTVEYFEFNVAGAYVGPRTPMFLWIPDIGASSENLQSHPSRE